MNNQELQFEEEINKVINRFRSEYDLTYAQAIGCLTITIHQLMHEDDEEENEETT